MTVPNILSLFRICLVPVFAVVYFLGGQFSKAFAALIYALASLTDVLDGKIARKFNQVSKLGRILDPLGDKLMTFTVLLCITISKVIPIWAIIIFVVKELLMTIGGMIILRKIKDMPPSNYFGKVSTVVFFVICVVLMLFDVPEKTAAVLISFAICVMLFAFASYIIRYVQIIKKHFREANAAEEGNNGTV